MSKKNHNHIRMTAGQRAFRVLNVTLLLLLCVLILYPFFTFSRSMPRTGSKLR